MVWVALEIVDTGTEIFSTAGIKTTTAIIRKIQRRSIDNSFCNIVYSPIQDRSIPSKIRSDWEIAPKAKPI